ncbi:hypothetical protein BSL78_21935 [Apostichopus japonicus]|uniref:Glycosyltransferase 61 catalytic domain-containing protein n=1 Tax=Stichopus japonicus TaxID=307972 RepID=A0A2G8JZQ5_STIJA|nr:hypothetical protein BSL78_21935 [Apostichopus japonicus]
MFRNRLIGDAKTIYRLFTQNEPILQLDFDEYLPDQSVVCFEDVTIGLSNSSMWYQWGMDELHEGPLLDPKVTPEHFRKFKNYLIEKMNINIVCPQISYGVLFTRKRTRQILNQNELASSIEKEFEISIQVVGMEDNSIMEIIRIVSCAELLISMHGALMILAMFLPRHAVVVEMYPYAINPEFYQVYQTMLNLQDLDIKYIAWRNMNASNAIEPPSYRFHLNNLSEEKRLAILSRTEAPRKVCCYDPEWQYRMYQNTVVNVTEVIKLLKKHCI